MSRVVIFSLRAGQAHDEAKRGSKGLASYVQWSFGMGFIGIAHTLVNLLRCLIVNATYGSENNPRAPVQLTSQESTSISTYELKKAPIDGNTSLPMGYIPDQPLQRSWSRRFAGFSILVFLTATVTGIIAALDYTSTMIDQKQAEKVMQLRYRITHLEKQDNTSDILNHWQVCKLRCCAVPHLHHCDGSVLGSHKIASSQSERNNNLSITYLLDGESIDIPSPVHLIHMFLGRYGRLPSICHGQYYHIPYIYCARVS